MKYRKLLLILLFLAGLLILSFFFQDFLADGNKSKSIEINGNNFKVEIVSSPEKMAKGLGKRDNLCEKCGMLFEFSEKGRHAFWMKGMRFNLDIIWIDGDRIVHIAENVAHDSLEVIKPEVEADSVLEINAGLAKKLNIKAGDKIYPIE
jgi:uncharacterized protein